MRIPSLLAIEIASGCNARCPYCARTAFGHHNKVMEVRQYKKILLEARSIGVKQLRLYLWGEPTLNKNLVLFAALAHGLGFDVELSSNGHLFDKYLEVLRYVSSVRFSVDGWDPSSYARHRVGLDFFRVRHSLRSAYAFREKNNLTVALRIGTVSARDIDVGTFLDCWYGDGKIVDSIHFMGMSPFSVYNKESRKFELGYNDLWRDKYFIWKRQDISPSSPKKFRCAYLYDIMCIGTDGKLSLCCNDLHSNICNVNVFEIGLIKSYNCKVLNTIRKHHEQGDYRLCQEGCMVFYEPTAEWNLFQTQIRTIAREKGLDSVVS